MSEVRLVLGIRSFQVMILQGEALCVQGRGRPCPAPAAGRRGSSKALPHDLSPDPAKRLGASHSRPLPLIFPTPAHDPPCQQGWWGRSPGRPW